MTLNIDWNDIELDRLLHSVHGPVGDDLERRALAVEATQKRLLSLHGTGAIYQRRSVSHQASAPGEPPAVDTGRLRASVGHEVGYDAEGLYANVGSGASPAVPGVDYAEYLEYGTRHMEPRPWLRPSVTAAEGDHHA